MLIYKITNKINDKFYIGQTRNKLNRRWSDHIGAAGKGSLAPIHQAIRKYGRDNFTLEILQICNSFTQLNNVEIELIKSLKPQYNIHHGGNIEFNYEHSKQVKEAMKRPEVREKMLKIRNDPVINAKLRKALRERVHSNKDTVKKMIAGGMQFAKPIIAIEIKSGKKIIFESQREASRELKMPNSSIRRVLRGTSNKSHGFIFEYK